ncbi:MAG: 30S ribosomal protein S20 [Acidobacteria bacterium]|nr:30S ribosomal protein S20 [Acidobacteriota bacterium]
MPNTVSAIKRVRITERRTAINQARKTRLRNQIRSMRKLIAEKNATAALAALPATFSVVDKAAKLGVIKKNTASRYKSRLAHHVKKLSA